MHKHLLVGVAVSTALALILTGCSTGTHTSPPETVKSVSPLAPVAAHKIDASADAKAASILDAETATLRATFATGLSEDNSPAGVTWDTAGAGNPVTVQKAIFSAFRNADGLFTADDEPTTPISDWRNSSLPGDITTWCQATGATQGTALAKVNADFAAMVADAKAVAAGRS